MWSLRLSAAWTRCRLTHEEDLRTRPQAHQEAQEGEEVTNATKAGVIAVVNALLGLAVSFDIALTQAQTGAILAATNAVLGLWVALTYKDSAKRIPDTSDDG